jgi:uncharacterized protein (DUF1330 family)
MSAYVMFIREETVDQGELDTYRKLVGPVLAEWPVEYLAAHGRVEALEGPVPAGVVLVKFPSMDEARDWYHSAAYQAIIGHRLAGGRYRGLLVEGI